ncbi:MAG: amino acid adenylation domain-containing protein [Candidatus Eremiobacteraeota bacterium]|nr:amino acid adenylation domain-containing protein [Candidatus Eremiobacteraeota bacterium]MBC5803022.1 amino acid adenylation domain-containing protein [Candidatus Eremiobacteraeota bacterium]MBC5821345.1 amino acid adenylation domain-containing protein [Candidatus Eremiobacteraeota bacterium]
MNDGNASVLDKALGAGGTVPLSFAQEQLWIVEQLLTSARPYNARRAFHLAGPLDVVALERSLNAIVRRHAILRTTFSECDGEPVQVVAPSLHVFVALEDIENEIDREGTLPRRIADESGQPFDLATGPLVRATLFRLGPLEHVLLLVLHHAVWDGASTPVFNAELGAGYRAYRAGEALTLPDLPMQYADFARWQRQSLGGQDVAEQLRYWRDRLAGAPPAIELPGERERPAVMTFRGAAQTRLLPRALLDDTRALARAAGASTFMTLLAAFAALLSRYTGQHDLVIGTPSAGRSRTEFEELIGFFVNTLPLRIAVTPGVRFRELLDAVRNDALDAYDRQDVPFERLVAELQPERSLATTPLFNVMFLTQGEGELGAELELEGLEIRPFPLESTATKFDLTFRIAERQDGLLCSMQYSTDLFEAATIEQMLRHFENLLRGALAEPDATIAALPMLDDAERRRLVVEWNHTERPYSSNCSIHALVSDQAAKMPDAVALNLGDWTVTYGVLERRADRLARALLVRGVAPGEPVGFVAARDPDSIVAMLGILKAGAAYVPLDPEYPSERICYMLDDAKVRLVVVPPSASSFTIPADRGITAISSDQPDDGGIAVLPLVGPDDPAYAIYTSGSTGKPKGVVVSHRAIARLVTGTDYVTIDKTDVMGGVSSLSFDAATFEVWGTLVNGARLAIIPRNVTLSSEEFAVAIGHQRVTIMFLTSALFRHVARYVPTAFSPLRCLLVGGDAVDAGAVRTVLVSGRPRQLLNGYGPTEATTFACTYEIVSAPGENVPIGRPIANTQAYILDADMNPVPIGCRGQLYIGGPGLARGYLNDDELTASVFVVNPFVAGARLYATGDLARYRDGGTIEFLGRADRQVKVRGFRIELGEVESALKRIDGVGDAAARVCDDELGDKRLVAYVTESHATGHDGEHYRRLLAQRLPRYLVPNTVTVISSSINVALTVNGKTDRERILAPVPTTHTAPRAPESEAELRLASLWRELLNVRDVTVDDDFFALGGDSLLAARLAALMKKRWGTPLSLGDVFSDATLGGLARKLTGSAARQLPSFVVEIRPASHGQSLFFVNGGFDRGRSWHEVAKGLGEDFGFYGLSTLRADRGWNTVEALAEEFIAVMRTIQPHGPYRVAGYCAGGFVAFEMARRLAVTGLPVSDVVLIDEGLGERLPRLEGLLSGAARARLLPARFVHRLSARLRFFWRLDRRERRRFVLGHLASFFKAPVHSISREGSPKPDAFAMHILHKIYVPGWYGGRLTLVWAADAVTSGEQAGFTKNWRAHARDVDSVEVAGNHVSAMTQHGAALGAMLRRRFTKAGVAADESSLETSRSRPRNASNGARGLPSRSS